MERQLWSQAARAAVLGVLGVLLLTVWWAAEASVAAIATTSLALLVFAWLVGVRRLLPFWHMFGMVLVGGLLAVLVVGTGGADSPYQDMFLLVVLGAALLRRTFRRFVEGVVIAAVGAALPAAYQDVGADFLGDTIADVLVWTAVGIIAWRLERSRADHAAARAELLERHATVTEDERGRLAEDLHDEAIQLLSAARFRLQTAAMRNDTSTDVAAAEELLGQGLLSLRRIILELHAPDVETGSLTDLVQAYAERLLEPVGVTVDLEIAEPERTDPAVVTAAYRIVVQALSNVARHAGASRVTVDVHEVDGQLVGLVVDDGRGIPDRVQTRPGHIGLRSMHDRAAALGGSVEVRAVPAGQGSGTVVSFELPRRSNGAAGGRRPGGTAAQ